MTSSRTAFMLQEEGAAEAAHACAHAELRMQAAEARAARSASALAAAMRHLRTAAAEAALQLGQLQAGAPRAQEGQGLVLGFWSCSVSPVWGSV